VNIRVVNGIHRDVRGRARKQLGGIRVAVGRFVFD